MAKRSGWGLMICALTIAGGVLAWWQMHRVRSPEPPATATSNVSSLEQTVARGYDQLAAARAEVRAHLPTSEVVLPLNPPPPHLPEWADFKDGKVWPNKRPGLGVTLDKKPLKLLAEVTKPGPPRTTYTRPDGSMTNW